MDPTEFLGDAVAEAAKALGGGARRNRAARRARHDGTGAGEGKHPLGATKPFVIERKATARARRKAARRKGGR